MAIPTIGAAFESQLHAAQAGAGWAFERLYEATAGAVAGYLRAQGVAEVEDTTSEVFLAAFTRLDSFRGNEAQFRSWLFTIAHNKVIDARRRNARRPTLGPLPDEVPLASDSAEDAALAALGTAHVHALLSGLSPDQRDVLALRIVADLTVEQVAEALGKRPGAVKALQRRGLEALRKKLTEAVPL